jgi:hypothetical protein
MELQGYYARIIYTIVGDQRLGEKASEIYEPG